MCGIAGRVNFKKHHSVDPKVIKAMCDSITHRGPDDEGFFINENVGLGHRRLSIIDLSTGHQPIFNEDETLAIVFNGEIYNFPELKKNLVSTGHVFKTNTDTEVIVHAYEEYGESCLDHLNGMFSFALWDSSQEKLFLARDRIGKKPLYYSFDDEKIVFASELKALTCDSSVKRDIDRQAIDLYLGHGYIPAPYSIYSSVKKVLPGHFISIKKGVLEEKQYWTIKYDYTKKRTEEEEIASVLSILHDSVERRLISDVPLGAFLSGGVDSSAIVSLMSRFSKGPVKTFSIGFKEEEYNELEDARFVAKTFKTEHHEEIVEPDSINLIPKLVWHYDEPFADSSAIPTYYVSRLAREHVKVVLSGDGGDELFGGYLRYCTSERDQKFLQLPDWVRKKIIGGLGTLLPKGTLGRNYFRYIAKDALPRYLMSVGCFSDDQKDELYSKEFLSLKRADVFSSYLQNVSDKDLVTQFLFLDSKTYLPDDILVKVDKASMAESLEVRVPILDYKLIEYAATIRPSRKINPPHQKIIFKKALADLLPEQVFTKKKHGFGVPLDRWFRRELKDMAFDVLLSQKASERGYFKMNQIRYLLEDHQRGRRDNSFFIWTLLFLELWHNQFIDAK